MAPISNEDYIYKHTGNGVYVRRCFGIEITGCKMAETCDGFTHLNVSAAVKVHRDPSSGTPFESSVRAAWMTLRSLVPGIACRSFKFPAPDESFAFSYTVPNSSEDARKWAEETVFFTDKISSLHEAHRLLKDTHWWLPSSNHYVAELHLSPSPHGWNLTMSLLHSFFDGRAAFSMVDLYLKFLTDELEGNSRPASSIQWGIETVRLQAPGSFTMSIATTGHPPQLPISAEEPVALGSNEKDDKPLESSTIKPWIPSPIQVGGQGDVSRIITFSPETTEKIHAIAKKHGRTITQLFTALYILAHTEMTLRTASSHSAKRFREVSGSFKDATHYLIAWTFMNHRHKFPGGYDSYESQTGSPLLAQDGTAPLLPMKAVRALFKIDEQNNSSQRVVRESAFWDGLVAAVSSAWKDLDQSLEAYLAREVAGNIASSKFDAATFHIPLLIISSIGDLGRLGMLNKFLPRTQHPATKMSTLTVEDVITGLRSRIPITVNLLYQYNGQLSSHFATAGEYTSMEELQMETDIFEEWVNALVSGL